ncbi:MAG: class I SAM-dependent methyltransferase [Spirochaetales bacterium]|nr:class I SAM-dependent methyltransferase [Spirochaetales bacterium]
MYEIYDRHSYEYDELLRHEDHEKNLPAKMNELFDFRGKTVLEFGTGTGRLTAIYAPSAGKIFCFDRSGNMLDKAKNNLSGFSEKIIFGFCDNNEIGMLEETGDFLIEGWSFGHTVSDYEEGSAEEAARICGFFFGPEMEASIRRKRSAIVKEYTGVWYKRPPGDKEL